MQRVAKVKAGTSVAYGEDGDRNVSLEFAAAEAAESLLQDAERRCAYPEATDKRLFASVRALAAISQLLDPKLTNVDVSGDAKDYWPDSFRARLYDVGRVLTLAEQTDTAASDIPKLTREEQRGVMTVAVLAKQNHKVRASAGRVLSHAELACVNKMREDTNAAGAHRSQCPGTTGPGSGPACSKSGVCRAMRGRLLRVLQRLRRVCWSIRPKSKLYWGLLRPR